MVEDGDNPITSMTVVKTALKATLEAVAGTTSMFGRRPVLSSCGRPISVSSFKANLERQDPGPNF